MPWFRKTAPADPLAVSMTGVKLGDRVLVIGAGDPALIAALGAKTGLTGTTCGVIRRCPRRTMNEHYVKTGGAKRALEAERFLAVRVLAEREGLVFVEGAKR